MASVPVFGLFTIMNDQIRNMRKRIITTVLEKLTDSLSSANISKDIYFVLRKEEVAEITNIKIATNGVIAKKKFIRVTREKIYT